MGIERVTDAAVSDTGPLIHLGEIDSLELLSAFDGLFLPETVYEELERGDVPDGLLTLSFERVEPEVPCPQTDNLAAREAALESGLDVHGSLGVIARAHTDGLIDRDDAASLMRALQRETSLFVTDTIIDRGTQLLGEE